MNTARITKTCDICARSDVVESVAETHAQAANNLVNLLSPETGKVGAVQESAFSGWESVSWSEPYTDSDKESIGDTVEGTKTVRKDVCPDCVPDIQALFG